jgi:hypothetical protein
LVTRIEAANHRQPQSSHCLKIALLRQTDDKASERTPIWQMLHARLRTAFLLQKFAGRGLSESHHMQLGPVRFTRLSVDADDRATEVKYFLRAFDPPLRIKPGVVGDAICHILDSQDGFRNGS